MAKLNNLYPHLLPADIELWEDFLKLHGDQFLRFDYDVRVGNGREPDGDFPDNIRKMALDLSQRRIDVVGYTDSAIHIIEVTVSGGLKAIGQLEAYPILYTEKFNPTQKLAPLLVARVIEPDIEIILNKKRINYVELPA